MEEGSIEIALEPEDEPTTSSEVFFNDRMRVNRDISVATLQAAQRDLGAEVRVCDATAASGIRGLRYLSEADGIDHAMLVDRKPKAVENIKENIALNDIDDSRVSVRHADANLVMAENYRGFEFIDIDPFGTPLPFLDSAARAANWDSYVGITATDLAILAGSYEKVCRRHYAAQPLHNAFHHETGLRILIRTIFEAFSRYDFAFDLKYAYYEGHYYRVVGRVNESKKQCNRWLDRIGRLFYCRDCAWRTFTMKREWHSTCLHCGNDELEHAGPLWTHRLAEEQFLDEVITECEDRDFADGAAHLKKLRHEAGIIAPFYDTHALGSAVGTNAPRRDDLLEAIRDAGYRATETHFSPTGIRTDAPITDIQDRLRG